MKPAELSPKIIRRNEWLRRLQTTPHKVTVNLSERLARGYDSPYFQCEGVLVKMGNTRNLVSPGGRPQSHILHSLYLLKARVTCVGAPYWCSMACDRFPQCRSSIISPCSVPRTIPPAPLAYCFSCRSNLSHSCSACGRIWMDP